MGGAGGGAGSGGAGGAMTPEFDCFPFCEALLAACPAYVADLPSCLDQCVPQTAEVHSCSDAALTDRNCQGVSACGGAGIHCFDFCGRLAQCPEPGNLETCPTECLQLPWDLQHCLETELNANRCPPTAGCGL